MCNFKGHNLCSFVDYLICDQYIKQMVHSNGGTPVMTTHGLSQSQQMVMDGTNHSGSSNTTDVEIPPEAQPPAPSATLVENMDMHECSAHDRGRVLFAGITVLKFQQKICLLDF